MKKLLIILFVFCLSFPAFAFQGDNYITPDSWSKHITANGVKASTKGIDIGNGTLSIGLTERLSLRLADDNDFAAYQYVRARLSEVKLGSGTVSVNLNMRGSWNENNRDNLREYHVFYSPFDKDDEDFDFRLYQGNVNFENVIPYLNISLGRIYLTAFDGYKIDGGNIAFNVFDYGTINAYYGVPVSYYSYLKTQLVGGAIDVPIKYTNTRIRGEYSYFMYDDNDDMSTSVLRGRIDQQIPTSNVYVEGAIIGDAYTYEAGVDGNLDISSTGFSGYVMGQYDNNKEGEINPYLAMYESELGAMSEYFMGGVQLYQGIGKYVMVGLGFEGRYNFSETYADRDYYRGFATLDLVGLIHKENFLSIIADYYTVAKYKSQDEESKLLVGARMTQRVVDSLDLWAGVNVMNYQFKNNPIKLNSTAVGYPMDFEQLSETENTTLAYIGGMYQPADWCVIQLDYTFEYSDIFKKFDKDNENMQIVELWVNFLW